MPNVSYTENPNVYQTERLEMEAENLAELREHDESERVGKRRDLCIALEEFCRHERFLAKYSRGEFNGNEKRLKRRLAKFS